MLEEAHDVGELGSLLKKISEKEDRLAELRGYVTRSNDNVTTTEDFGKGGRAGGAARVWQKGQG